MIREVGRSRESVLAGGRFIIIFLEKVHQLISAHPYARQTRRRVSAAPARALLFCSYGCSLLRIDRRATAPPTVAAHAPHTATRYTPVTSPRTGGRLDLERHVCVELEVPPPERHSTTDTFHTHATTADCTPGPRRQPERRLYPCAMSGASPPPASVHVGK